MAVPRSGKPQEVKGENVPTPPATPSISPTPRLPIPPMTFGRAPHGISAAYLPWRPVGIIDWESYAKVLERTWGCGLVPAINMDTGFANLLTPSTRDEVLKTASQLAAGRPFVAGAFVEDLQGDCIRHYQQQMESIESHGGMPIVFQSKALLNRPLDGLILAYKEISRSVQRFLGFELGTMFAPFGAIYDLTTFARLMEIPQLVGVKHSSLSRELEWQRLELRNRHRPEFRIYTGNDLAIDMVQWGSDYLLGLSAFYPEAFAVRDRFWRDGDRRFYELNDLLQLLGGFAFRDPVPAYKHNAAMVLAMRGVIARDAIHPDAPSRPSSDREFLAEVVHRIDGCLR
jgi:dihydrodipicolinate synthase/N-acetylneuraminate lyase